MNAAELSGPSTKPVLCMGALIFSTFLSELIGGDDRRLCLVP